MTTIQNQHFKGQIPWRSEWDLFKKQFSQDIFGGKDWERYFGAIGNEPIIHDDSIDFLKQLLKTHLLLLIPQKVNGHPFTLNYLHNLIENKIAPTFYDKDIRSELGEQQTSHSYWVIMTKRPNWCSEAKEYQFYYKKLENIQKRNFSFYSEKERVDYFVQKAYEFPTVLESVTATSINYLKTREEGSCQRELLYRDYTFCKDLLPSIDANAYAYVGEIFSDFRGNLQGPYIQKMRPWDCIDSTETIGIKLVIRDMRYNRSTNLDYQRGVVKIN